MTGIAAILSYSLPEIEEFEHEDGNDSYEEDNEEEKKQVSKMQPMINFFTNIPVI